MKKFAMIAAAGTLSLTACATDPYGYDDPYRSSDSRAERVAKGAAVGAVAGAVVGAVVDGVSPLEGAAAGAVAGGVIGAVIKGKQYYRDTRGYCYYVDRDGYPVYDYDADC